MKAKLPLSIIDWSRSIAGTPDINLTNRYFEQDPTNQANQCSLIARPALKKWITLPTSPVRNVYSQPGALDNSLFAASGNKVYEVETDETVTEIGTLSTSTGFVSMAATDTYLFIADGGSLKYYTKNDYARGTLTASGTVSAAQTVTIGGIVYKFVADVTGAADGSAGTPWLVLLGANTAESLQHLFDAIGGTGDAGVDYSLFLTAHTTVVPSAVTATVLTIRSTLPGTGGNATATTETMANASWGAVTLAGGGGSSFNTVSVPDGDGIISVGVIISFTICVVAQDDAEKNGRYYWIRPGENTIQLLDFATAERSPDPASAVVVLGDQFWLPGDSTIEVWNPSGDGNAPFERQLGRLFERGAWAGTVVPLGEAMMLVDSTGGVWEVTDAPRLVSTPGVSQRIREAINTQRAV